jgi:hypothetical protein
MNIGDKFNKLTLIKRTAPTKSGTRYYKTGIFICECGNEKMVVLNNVETGNTKSCGCNYKISNKDKKWGRK